MNPKECDLELIMKTRYVDTGWDQSWLVIKKV